MSILCLESGGTKLVAAWADGEARLREREVAYRQPDQTATQTLEVLIRLGRQVAAGRPPSVVALGFGGLVDRRRQAPAGCFHEAGWEDLDPACTLADAFSAPAWVENDCKLAALAEAARGAGRPGDRLLYVTVGTGIGAGYVHDGRLLALGDLGEMELGHMLVEPKGPPCGCGQRGCLETLCSGPGLEELSRWLTGQTITAQHLMQRWRSSDATASQIIETAAEYMALALAAAVNLTAPTCVVLGGGVMTGNPEYLDLVRGKTMQRVFPPFRAAVRWELSTLGSDVVCQGAALWALQRLGQGSPGGDLQGAPGSN
jgi:glucokinase